MDILFKNKSVETQFSSKHQKKWRYPNQVKIKLLATENAFLQATSLKDIVSYPPFHFHQWKGTRKNEWSIYLGNTGYRVVIVPCDDSGNIITSGDIISECAKIKVVLVTEVSNHYE